MVHERRIRLIPSLQRIHDAVAEFVEIAIKPDAREAVVRFEGRPDADDAAAGFEDCLPVLERRAPEVFDVALRLLDRVLRFVSAERRSKRPFGDDRVDTRFRDLRRDPSCIADECLESRRRFAIDDAARREPLVVFLRRCDLLRVNITSDDRRRVGCDALLPSGSSHSRRTDQGSSRHR